MPKDGPPVINVLIIGAGRGGAALLPVFYRDKSFRIIALVDKNEQAPGVQIARTFQIPTAQDFTGFLKRDDLDLIVDVTGDHEVAASLARLRRPETELIGPSTSRVLWGLIEEGSNLLEYSPGIIIISDADGCILSFNRGAEEKLGYTKEEVIGQSMTVFHAHPQERLDLMERVKRERSIAHHEVQLTKKDGSLLDVSLAISQWKDDEGRPIGTLDIGMDVTEEKRLRLQLQEYADHLEKRVEERIREEKRLIRQLIQSEKLAGLGVIIAGIAHEINNPLYVMVGMAEAILQETKLPLIHEYARDILKHGRTAAQIVSNLTFYSRASDARTLSAVDVHRCLNYALKIVKHSAKSDGVEFVQDYHDVPFISANPGEIQQVFVNVINNAVDAMQGAGTVLIATRHVHSEAMITIRDTGPGILQKNLTQVFDPFFTTKEAGKGTGLGLNIAYRIVTQYQGTIEVESEEGQGATFIIKFPERG